MRFPGELKFPDLDHPGVPVEFHVEGTQAELKLEGESLGKWSLYDVRADRLIASAFLVKLADEEITFVADDPIDFAYRGVEHMAGAWAGMKTKRLGSRGIAVSRSRRGTVASRLGEVREAMEQNLSQRPLAGEPAMPTGTSPVTAETAPADTPADWDQRDTVGEIPAVGAEPKEDAADFAPPEQEVAARAPDVEAAPPPDLTAEQLRLEEERRRLEEERVSLERQRAESEQREANLFEAYRLEVQRLEEEREELRRQAAAAAERAATGAEAPDAQPVAAHESSDGEPEPTPETSEPAEVAADAEVAPTLSDTTEPEAVPEQVKTPADAEGESGESESEESETLPEESVVDLKEYETGRDEETPKSPSTPPTVTPAPAPAPRPEPALAAVSPKEKAGLMGAVRAAFRGGARDHEHHFTEAPGGLGITRYVCEDCGYVSIAVGS